MSVFIIFPRSPQRSDLLFLTFELLRRSWSMQGTLKHGSGPPSQSQSDPIVLQQQQHASTTMIFFFFFFFILRLRLPPAYSSFFFFLFLSISAFPLLVILLPPLPAPCYASSPQHHHHLRSSRRTDVVEEAAAAMFLFSDSLGDTGNGPFVNHSTAAQLPYGITFPGYAAGRFSDGRVLVSDFIAEYLSLPPLKPWMNVYEDFRHGVNYAIPGCTATDMRPFSLQEQVDWHLGLVALAAANHSSSCNITHQSSSSDSPRTKLPSLDVIQDGLYVISIGGLDYRYSYIDNELSPDLVGSTMVPLVVEQIRIALERLYNESGARKFLVVGVPAQGCLPGMLAFLSGKLEVNERGCMDAVNAICESHRHGVESMLRSLRELHADDATYAFLDFYQAHLYILERAADFGFTNTLDACCGAGPSFPYGFNDTHYSCKNDTSSLYVCDNPSSYINWDGLHFTHSFNTLLFNQTILADSFLHPPNWFGLLKQPFDLLRPRM